MASFRRGKDAIIDFQLFLFCISLLLFTIIIENEEEEEVYYNYKNKN